MAAAKAVEAEQCRGKLIWAAALRKATAARVVAVAVKGHHVGAYLPMRWAWDQAGPGLYGAAAEERAEAGD